MSKATPQEIVFSTTLLSKTLHVQMYLNAQQYLGRERGDRTLLMDPYTNGRLSSLQKGSHVEHYVGEREDRREAAARSDMRKLGDGATICSPWSKNPTGQNTSDPKVWGPPLWFSLHSSAAHYPHNASPMVRDRMVNRILALPVEIPCASCRPHARAYIESKRDLLPEICSTRDALFAFYVDFHNKVNQRYNKPIVRVQEARQMWGVDS